MDNHIDEGSTAYLTVSCKDKDGNLSAPSSVSYSIYCLTTKQEVRPSSVVTPASQFEIKLTPTDAAILTTTNKSEKKRVTVKTIYGADDGVNDEYDFVVKNLSGVS